MILYINIVLKICITIYTSQSDVRIVYINELLQRLRLINFRLPYVRYVQSMEFMIGPCQNILKSNNKYCEMNEYIR